MTEEATWTTQEKDGLTNDLNMMFNLSMEHGQYLFNLIAAVNVQHDILIEKKLITEDELKDRIEAEIEKMKLELMNAKNEKTREGAEETSVSDNE